MHPVPVRFARGDFLKGSVVHTLRFSLLETTTPLASAAFAEAWHGTQTRRHHNGSSPTASSPCQRRPHGKMHAGYKHTPHRESVDSDNNSRLIIDQRSSAVPGIDVRGGLNEPVRMRPLYLRKLQVLRSQRISEGRDTSTRPRLGGSRLKRHGSNSRAHVLRELRIVIRNFEGNNSEIVFWATRVHKSRARFPSDFREENLNFVALSSIQNMTARQNGTPPASTIVRQRYENPVPTPPFH